MPKMTLKRKTKTIPNRKPNRKQLRKEKRKEKKVKRNEYYVKRGNGVTGGELEAVAGQVAKDTRKTNEAKPNKTKRNKSEGSKVLSTEELYRKEKREEKKIQKDMSKQRKELLMKANAKEDETIRKLEKQLKLHKRKTKAIPKSFVLDGLDYLLEICDPEYMKNAAAAEQDLKDGNDNFEEDFALMTGRTSNKKKIKEGKVDSREEDEYDSFEDILNEDDQSEDDYENEDQDLSGSESDDNSNQNSADRSTESHFNDGETNLKQKRNMTKQEQSMTSSKHSKVKANKNDKQRTKSDASDEDNHIFASNRKSHLENLIKDEKAESKKPADKRKLSDKDKIRKKRKKNSDVEEFENRIEDEAFSDGNITSGSEKLEGSDGKEKDIWEDIYGRLRSKDGAVLKEKEGKYMPPAIRAKMELTGSEDKKRKETLDRLRKQIKGFLNRLAESNMHNIANQIEALYMNNSRNDMNKTLTTLIIDSLITTVSTPERLLMEHTILIAILHANIGTEIGANFLHTVIKKFDVLTQASQKVEDKSLDNVVNILAQLYNFKVFDAKLLYEILHRLAGTFDEKNVECILHILRSVGFGLRKDDPLALKNLILELQKQAASASEGKVSNSRVKFLLDVLLAIKNNNVTKIPNYDTTYSEHLKKIMKGFIRKGNYVTPLNISLEDLLKADERGKWWVVGSAWTGNIESTVKIEKPTKAESISRELLNLAKKQRMNTDTRRDIFCIIMSAEDYLDAFEKLLRLGLKNQQDREIIHVILHCCLQEKVFNPYYAVLAQKFCDYDRKYQMIIKCSVWDKLKALSSHSGGQLSNLAKLLTHLFINRGLPISTLKIVEFSELDKVTLRLVRQILLGILLHHDLEGIQGVFDKVAQSDKLKMFRESLRLFIHHFLLRNLKTEAIPEDKKQNLERSAKMVEKILTAKDVTFKL